MKKKITLSVLVIILFTLIGIGIGTYKTYIQNDKAKTSKYKKEIADVLNLDGNKSVIRIIKEDINNDETDDYIVLLGEEKFDETTNKSKYINFNKTLEMYNNVSVEYIDGVTKECNRYNTNKSFGTDISIKLEKFNEKKYIFVSDTTTGNVCVLNIEEKELKDIISNSFSTFVGYTIDASIDDNEKKLKIKLDNYGRDYLPSKDEEYTLDLNDTNVNSKTYRITYMANKYCKFELKVDENNNLSLVTTQYILYSNDKTLDKNYGKINIKFNLDTNENKFKFDNLQVEP